MIIEVQYESESKAKIGNGEAKYGDGCPKDQHDANENGHLSADLQVDKHYLLKLCLGSFWSEINEWHEVPYESDQNKWISCFYWHFFRYHNQHQLYECDEPLDHQEQFVSRGVLAVE